MPLIEPSPTGLEGFNSFYETHATAVHASARLICGSAGADDVARDVLVSAWGRPGWPDPNEDVARTQMIVAVYRHAEDGYRKAGTGPWSARLGRRKPNFGAGSRRSESATSTPSDALDSNLRSLREQGALALVLIGNCCCREVARLLNESEADVVDLLSSAMRRLGP